MLRSRGPVTIPSPRQIADLARTGNEAALLTYRRFGENLVRALGGNLSRSFDLFGAAASAALEAEGVHIRLRPAADIGGAALNGAASLLLGRT